MTTTTDRAVFLGIKGHVVRIDPVDGAEVWRTRLRSSSITSVLVTPERVLAYAGGHLFALDPRDGRVLWQNELSGLGWGFCSIATVADSASGAGAARAAAEQAAAAAAIAAAAAGAAASS